MALHGSCREACFKSKQNSCQCEIFLQQPIMHKSVFLKTVLAVWQR